MGAHQSRMIEQRLLDNLQRLQKDPSGWEQVVADFLDAVPPGVRLDCKDRRILDGIHALCERELSSRRPSDAAAAVAAPSAAVPLLHVAARLLAARGLYSALPRYSLQPFVHALRRSAARVGSDWDSATTASLHEAQALIALLDVFQAIAEPGASSKAEIKYEKAARDHLHAAGAIPALASLLSALGARPACARSLPGALGVRLATLLHSLLSRPHTTDYALTCALVEALVPQVKK